MCLQHLFTLSNSEHSKREEGTAAALWPQTGSAISPTVLKVLYNILVILFPLSHPIWDLPLHQNQNITKQRKQNNPPQPNEMKTKQPTECVLWWPATPGWRAACAGVWLIYSGVAPWKKTNFPSLFSSCQSQISYWIRVGPGAHFSLFSCWDLVWFESVLVLCTLSQTLWVHPCISSVVSGKSCFRRAIHHLWLLQSLCSLFCIDPWALREGVIYMYIYIFFFIKGWVLQSFLLLAYLSVVDPSALFHPAQ